MTTDNRTNEQIVAGALSKYPGGYVEDRTVAVLFALEAAGRLAEESNQNETKSDQTFRLSEAQIEAAAKALREMRDFDEGVSSLLLEPWSRMVATTALEAAVSIDGLAKLADIVDRVRKYADERSVYAKTRNNTVGSWRIASDLYEILGVSREDQESVEEICGARAEDGWCILPRAHNMGNLDIPENHKSADHER